jgi:hypothetical protein
MKSLFISANLVKIAGFGPFAAALPPFGVVFLCFGKPKFASCWTE